MRVPYSPVFLLLARESVKWKGAWGHGQKRRDMCGDRWKDR